MKVEEPPSPVLGGVVLLGFLILAGAVGMSPFRFQEARRS
jgi:hypothetical protein